MCQSKANGGRRCGGPKRAPTATLPEPVAQVGTVVSVRCSRPEKVYHVATDESWQRIRQEGLIPAIGGRSSSSSEAEPRVYLFGSRQDVDDALGNWLGEEFEDYEGDLIILEVATPSAAEPTFPDAETSWEWSTTAAIPAQALTVVDRC